MVIHQDIRIQIEVILSFSSKQILKKLLIIIITDKYLLPVITAAGDMIAAIFAL
ncbi:MAG: hypothetical protein Q8P40_10030 [Nitrospirota bacterium]|nr:hypothetical protein [Nitrospirota bacterium]